MEARMLATTRMHYAPYAIIWPSTRTQTADTTRKYWPTITLALAAAMVFRIKALPPQNELIDRLLIGAARRKRLARRHTVRANNG